MSRDDLNELIEWAYRFDVYGDALTADRLEGVGEELLQGATVWAEQRDLGVGGGYTVEGTSEGLICRFEFGLTATSDEQLIRRSVAEDLLAHISDMAVQRGCLLEGGVRPYSDDEQDLAEVCGE